MALCQEYIPTEWFDNTAPAINAANLNHLEIGIKNITDCVMSNYNEFNDRLTSIETRLTQLEAAPPAHTHPISDIVDLQTQLNRKPNGTWSRSGTTLYIDIEGS